MNMLVTMVLGGSGVDFYGGVALGFGIVDIVEGCVFLFSDKSGV